MLSLVLLQNQGNGIIAQSVNWTHKRHVHTVPLRHNNTIKVTKYKEYLKSSTYIIITEVNFNEISFNKEIQYFEGHLAEI